MTDKGSKRPSTETHDDKDPKRPAPCSLPPGLLRPNKHTLLTVDIDDSNRLSVTHSECGQRMEMAMTSNKIEGVPGMLNRIWVRCVPCKLKWLMWRKTTCKTELKRKAKVATPEAKVATPEAKESRE